MKVLVLYNSRNGHTQAAAEAIAATARRLNHDTTIKAVSQVRASDVEQADKVFIGTWVQGFILFGVKPAGATLWAPALPALQGKGVAVFCTYLFNPRASLRTLVSLLQARGGNIVGERAFQRRWAVQKAEQFAEDILEHA